MKMIRSAQLTATMLAAVLVLSACTRAGDAATVTTTVAAAVQPPVTAPAGKLPAHTTSGSGPASTAPTTSTSTATSASKATPAISQTPAPTLTHSTTPAAKPVITTTPAAKSTKVSPIAPVVVRSAGGNLKSVSLTNPEGRLVSGRYSAGQRSWTSAEPLGYNRSYTIAASASSANGVSTTMTSAFTTLKPATTVFPSFFPNPQMKTVGIGQPIVVIFDKAPIDKAAAEKTLSVKTTPAVEGSWYWWDSRTLHYRPKSYWAPGTKITVNAKVYGVNFGGGMYGETDRTLNLTIGASKIAKIDNATKQMNVFVSGKKVRTVPVSMGMDKSITVNGKKISFVTPSGTYVAQERYAVKQMSSATYGLPTGYSLGYDEAIPLAVRISGSGIFIHSAPWSVADQGIRNVSHGCININPKAAQWFYNTFSYGDIVTVTGTNTKLDATDGYGDWNIPWEKWQQGSALR